MSCSLAPCPECPHIRVPVPGDGPLDAEVVGIAESPGRDEDAKGRPFMGRTGREMNELYLPLAGLRRDDIYFTNTVKCWPRSDRDLSDNIVDSCSGTHLRAELAQLRNMKIVILMGAVACSLVGLDVDMYHGRLRRVTLLGYDVTVWPMYHPALGMHDYAKMNDIMEDWRALGEYLRTGEYEEPVDEYPNPKYVRIRDPRIVQETFAAVEPDNPVAIDTEYDPLPIGVRPYCLTYTLRPGSGYLIKDEDKEAVQGFAGCMGLEPSRSLGIGPRHPLPLRRRGTTVQRRRRRKVLMHNSLADLPVVDAMGVPVDARDVEDTMILAYNLTTYPQGLKALAFRICGMEMVEFDELVTPYALDYWLAYIEMVSQDLWPKPEPYMRLVPENAVDPETGVTLGKVMVEKLYKPQGLTTKMKRLITDYKKAPGPKVFKRWWEWDDVEKAPCIAKYGDMPTKSIRMVSDEDALLHYACRDSDATWRAQVKLTLERKNFRRHWRV